MPYRPMPFACAVLVLSLALVPSTTQARRCADGRTHPYCPKGGSGPVIGPTFLPPADRFDNHADYLAAVRSIRAKTVSEHAAHRLSEPEFKDRMGQIRKATGE